MPNAPAFAPFPSASVRIAVTVNPGDFVNFRNAIFRSLVILAALVGRYDYARRLVPFELRPVLFRGSRAPICSEWDRTELDPGQRADSVKQLEDTIKKL